MSTPPELESTHLDARWKALASSGTGAPEVLVDIADLLLHIRVEPGGEHWVLEIDFPAYGPKGQALRNLKFVSMEDVRLPPSRRSRRITIRFEAWKGANFRELWQHFAEDLTRNVYRTSPKTHVAASVAETLDTWRKIWPGPKGLSLEKRLGLYGELLILKRLADTTNISLATEAWHGPKARDHDFAAGSFALEVKSSSAKHSRVVIANLEQLNDAGLAGLYLVYVQLRRNDTPVNSLLHLGETILGMTDAVPGLRVRLSRKMFAAGWMKATEEEKQKTCYRCMKITGYHVQNGFPRILRDDVVRLGPALRVDRYQLDLSQCGKHELPSEALEELLQSFHSAQVDSHGEINIRDFLSASEEAADEEDEL